MFDLPGQTLNEGGVWTSMFDLLSNFEVRSWNFEHRLQCSMLTPPSSSASHPLFLLFFFLPFFCSFFSPFFFHAKLRSQTSKFQLRSSKLELRTQTSKFDVPPPLRQPPTVFLFLFFSFRFFCFLLFFFSLFFFHAKIRSQTSKFQLGISKLNFEVWVPSSNFEVRSSNFEHRLQCSMFPSPPHPTPASHPLLSFSFFFFRFFLFSFVFFLHLFFHAKLGSQTSKFQLRSSKFELRTQTSMFNVPPPPPPATHCFLFLFFLPFFLLFFSPFFHAKLRS